MSQQLTGAWTGRGVLIAFIVFFGVDFAVNFVMARAAYSSFTGLDTENSYETGLAFEKEVDAAKRQDALGWKVDAHLAKGDDATRAITVTVRDRNDQRVGDVEATVHMMRPTDRLGDHMIALRKVAVGTFAGASVEAPGQWDLVIDLNRGGERLFRSRHRIVLSESDHG